MTSYEPTDAELDEQYRERRAINLERVVGLVRADLPGVRCYVEQTGGGVATIYVGEPYVVGQHDDEMRPVLAGPGWFTGPGWSEGRADADDFSVGYDQDQPFGGIEYQDDEEPAERERKIAADIVRLYRAHPIVGDAVIVKSGARLNPIVGWVDTATGVELSFDECEARGIDGTLREVAGVPLPATFDVDVEAVVDGDRFSVDGGVTWHVAAVNMARMGTVSCYADPFPGGKRGANADTYRVDVSDVASARVARV